METNITGEEFDRRLKLLLDAPEQSQYHIDILQNDWKTPATPNDNYNYYLTIKLWGTFYDGFCPKIYFVDINNQKYTTNYNYQEIIENNHKTAMLTIYSNVNKAGKITIHGLRQNI